MILVVDDDKAIRLTLRLILERQGYEVALAASPAEAIDAVRKTVPSLILLDMNFSRSTSGEEGLELLRRIRIFCPDVPIIMMTAWGNIPLAVESIRLGAFDFITKPWDNAMLLRRIETAITLRRNAEQETADDNHGHRFDRSKIIGKNPGLIRVLDTVRRVATTDASVLITGENGTGKELIAEAIHNNSNRADGPFVKVNLGGISRSLFESEMFGHKKGAFTGAVADRKGRFELANNGTIFLDEIGELDAASQVKLLRVLQEQTFEPLGDSRPRRTDIRVVCATNADLPAMVKEHTFREDLYYRINLITLRLPPLRERRDDIPLLVRNFANRFAETNHMTTPEITADAMEFLSRLPFPGNIRELKNLVERAIIVVGDNTLTADHFRDQYQGNPTMAVAAAGNLKGMTLEEVEQIRVREALDNCGGNLTKAALQLGITRQSLYRRMQKFGIE